MTLNDPRPQSVTNRLIAFLVLVSIGPMSVRGYSQSAVSQIKPSEPIKPVTTTITSSDGDSADRVLADIGTYQVQQSKIVATEFADTNHPTRDELVYLYSQLRSGTPKLQEFIDRISNVLSADSQRGLIAPDRKEALELYLKKFKEALAESNKYIAEIDKILNEKAEGSTSVVDSSESTPRPTPTPAPTPTPKAWWDNPTVKGAAVTVAVPILIEFGKRVVDSLFPSGNGQ